MALLFGFDPYVVRDGVATAQQLAGAKERSLANVSAAFVLLMPANSARVGYEIEAAVANTGTTSIRYGLTGAEFEIVGGGAHGRNQATGGVFVGDIYVKSSVATDDVIAREW